MNFQIGDKVVKKSGKPFKSTNKVATIKGFLVNPQSPKGCMAASFLEDDSLVDLKQIKKYE